MPYLHILVIPFTCSGISHKLILSKLNRSILLGLLTILNLYILSSPAAVLPPIYHFSAPKLSLNPSDELSEPLLPRLCSGLSALPVPGDVDVPGLREYGDAECCLVGWKCVVEVWRATVVAPAPEVCCPDLVVIVLAAEGPFDDEEVEEAPFE
jgi:hypothetical protein